MSEKSGQNGFVPEERGGWVSAIAFSGNEDVGQSDVRNVAGMCFLFLLFSLFSDLRGGIH